MYAKMRGEASKHETPFFLFLRTQFTTPRSKLIWEFVSPFSTEQGAMLNCKKLRRQQSPHKFSSAIYMHPEEAARRRAGKFHFSTKIHFPKLKFHFSMEK